MGRCESQTLTLVTAVGGAATGYTNEINGKIVAVKYAKTDYTNGVVVTVTTNTTLENVWVETAVNAAKTVYPRAATHDTVGVASLYTAGQAVEDYVRACDEKIKIVIASGGDAKTGAFTVIWER